MKKNMGDADRIIRTIVAITIAALLLAGQVSGVLAIVLGVVAVAFVATSLISWCPSYVPFGITTLKDETGART